METEGQILQFISLQESAKQQDLLTLHELMTSILPTGKLWMEDGKNEEGKVVTNPTIGYGEFEQSYANGKRKTHFQIGLALTKQGFSFYLLGIRGKLDLANLCAEIGQAKVTGYCIQFKSIANIDINILKRAIQFALNISGTKTKTDDTLANP